jgi:hypothetical protein
MKQLPNGEGAWSLAPPLRRLTPALNSSKPALYDLGSDFGMFQIVTIGRAFHWMDRSEALRRLNTMIEPNGARLIQ